MAGSIYYGVAMMWVFGEFFTRVTADAPSVAVGLYAQRLFDYQAGSRVRANVIV
jgi:hypothetical protein